MCMVVVSHDHDDDNDDDNDSMIMLMKVLDDDVDYVFVGERRNRTLVILKLPPKKADKSQVRLFEIP